MAAPLWRKSSADANSDSSRSRSSDGQASRTRRAAPSSPPTSRSSSARVTSVSHQLSRRQGRLSLVVPQPSVSQTCSWRMRPRKWTSRTKAAHSSSRKASSLRSTLSAKVSPARRPKGTVHRYTAAWLPRPTGAAETSFSPAASKDGMTKPSSRRCRGSARRVLCTSSSPPSPKSSSTLNVGSCSCRTLRRRPSSQSGASPGSRTKKDVRCVCFRRVWCASASSMTPHISSTDVLECRFGGAASGLAPVKNWTSDWRLLGRRGSGAASTMIADDSTPRGSSMAAARAAAAA